VIEIGVERILMIAAIKTGIEMIGRIIMIFGKRIIFIA